MKAILAGLLFGAGTFLAISAAGMSASRDLVTEGRNAISHSAPTTSDTGLTEVASTSVLAPQRVAWNADANALYIVSMDALLLFEPGQGQRELLRITPGEMPMDVSANGVLAVMRDFDSIVLRDAHGGDETELIDGADISSVSFSPDGGTLAVVLDNGSLLQTWDVASGQMTGEYTSPSLAEGAFSVSFAPGGESLTWYSPAGGQALDLSTGDFGPFVSFTAGIYDVQMCSDTALVVATNGGGLTLWDTSNATMVHNERDMQVFSNSCAADGSTLAVTTEASVGLLDLPTMSAVDWITVEAVDAELSPSGERMAVVAADGEITVWQRQ